LKSARRSAGWKPTLNAVHFTIEIFADCSHADFLTNFSIAWKASASLCFASCTRNGSIGDNFEVSQFIEKSLPNKPAPAPPRPAPTSPAKQQTAAKNEREAEDHFGFILSSLLLLNPFW
jgi:hypothetical protein